MRTENPKKCIHYKLCFIRSYAGCAKTCKYLSGSCDNCKHAKECLETDRRYCGDWEAEDDKL